MNSQYTAKYTLRALRIVLPLIVLLLCGRVAVLAQARTEAEMEQIAVNFFKKQAHRLDTPTLDDITAPTLRRVARSSTIGAAAAANETFVVYAPDKGSGYVIVSTRSDQPQVLGFSPDETFDTAQMPPALTAYLRANAASNSDEHFITSEGDCLEPLLGNIQFNQTAPYLNLCPTYNGKACYTGCTATQMAQIMAYYRYPAHMYGDDVIQYKTNTYGIDVTIDPRETAFDWDLIQPVYTFLTSTDAPRYEGGETTASNGNYYVGSTSYQTDKATALQVLNSSDADMAGDMQVLLTSQTDSLICPLGEPTEVLIRSNQLPTNVSFTYTISPYIQEGTYRLHIGYRPIGSNVWYLLQSLRADREAWVEAKMERRVFKVNGESFSVGYTEEQGNAVALLSFACGAAISTDYTPEWSAAYANIYAWAQNFGYDNSMHEVYSYDYSSPYDLELKLVTNLIQGMPIATSGYTESNDGHSFVIDGYMVKNGLLYFHFNWGWGGPGDGYYLLNAEGSQASSGNKVNSYGYYQSFLLNLKPADYATEGNDSTIIFSVPVMTHQDYNLQCSYEEWLKMKEEGLDKICYPGELVFFAIYPLINCSPIVFSGMIQLELRNEEGERWFIADLGEGTYLPYSFGQLYGTILFPDVLPDGNYSAHLVFPGDVIVKEVEPTIIEVNAALMSIEQIGETERTENASVYSIDGRRLLNENIARGFYIKAGKKYLKRE